IGYVSVSVPHRRIPELVQHVGTDEDSETAIVTFNSMGQPLSSSAGFDDIDTILPADVMLDTLATAVQTTFITESKTGESRIFAA
ncbi:MAG: sensor histidine kinase, partial [Maritimibacter sp.]|nr:sensor histidine kinase [Maritimibacter sp.]